MKKNIKIIHYIDDVMIFAFSLLKSTESTSYKYIKYVNIYNQLHIIITYTMVSGYKVKKINSND